MDNSSEPDIKEEKIIKKKNAKRRWKDEESRTGGYSRAKFRNISQKVAADQMRAIEEA